MKKILMTSVITAIFLALSTVCSLANEEKAPAKVYINAVKTELDESTGVPYESENGQLMVPLRAVMEALGANVEWNTQEKCAIIEKDGNTLSVKSDSKLMKLSKSNDSKMLYTAAVPEHKEGRMYLPVRNAAEALGEYVLWNEQLGSVFVLTDEYRSFRDMFTYDGELSKYSDAVVVSARYKGGMSEDEFASFWTEADKTELEMLFKIIAADKQSLNPNHNIHINFWYPSGSDEKDFLLGSVSSFSFDAHAYNPFKEACINELNQ